MSPAAGVIFQDTPRETPHCLPLIAYPASIWAFWAAVGPGPLRDWHSSPLPNSTHLRPQLFADTRPSLLVFSPSHFLHCSEYFFSPSPGLNHSRGLKGKPRRATPALRGNLEAIYHCKFPLIKSFLSVTKPQLMVPVLPSSLTEFLQCRPRQKNFPNPHANKSC